MSKRPDSEVWNEEEGRHDAAFRSYPTTVGSPNFAPLHIKKAGETTVHYFRTRVDEIREEWKRLEEDLLITEEVFGSDYSFQPLERTTYYLYRRTNGTRFLSLIEPQSWSQELIYAVQLQSTGIWKILPNTAS